MLVSLLIAGCAHTPPPARTFSPERAFMEERLREAPGANPQLLFLLMAEYSSARQQRAGVEFFEGQRSRLGKDAPAELHALHDAILGTLRAQMAEQVPLLSRVAWVDKGIAELDRAVESTKGELFVVRWLRALVLAQLPAMFDREEMARTELDWAEENIARAPAPGMLREVLYLRGELYRKDGDETKAREYLKRSGYPAFGRPLALNTPFVIDRERGFAFDSPRIEEVVPGRVYEATGYEFTQFYFVKSADGTALALIDAGTRDDSVEQALKDLAERYPGLPPLRAVFVTHAHWDHVGGHRALRALSSKPIFYASEHWRAQMAHQEGTGGPYAMWWGNRFDLSAVLSFVPDVEVAGKTSVDLGGTRFELIPVSGGETRDALLVHLPAEGVAFGGDFVMPYLGAPFAEEGSTLGFCDALAVVRELAPKKMFHGHAGINRMFPNTEALLGIEAPLRWLHAQLSTRLAKGLTRAELHHENLIPHDLLANRPDLDLPYIVIREHFINRFVDEHRGYWEVGYTGADTLTRRELGSILVHYAELDIDDQIALVERMLDAGDAELALQTVSWLLPHAGKNQTLLALEKRAQLALVDQEQNLDAFKFIWYGAAAGLEVGAVQ
jgi:glyoxylase-like metal-dependent hydrolase (beta-lactamase superfamily II)